MCRPAAAVRWGAQETPDLGKEELAFAKVQDEADQAGATNFVSSLELLYRCSSVCRPCPPSHSPPLRHLVCDVCVSVCRCVCVCVCVCVCTSLATTAHVCRTERAKSLPQDSTPRVAADASLPLDAQRVSAGLLQRAARDAVSALRSERETWLLVRRLHEIGSLGDVRAACVGAVLFEWLASSPVVNGLCIGVPRYS